MYSTYDIWLRNATGTRVQFIDSTMLLSLTFAKSIYGEGSLEIVTTNAYAFSLYQQDGQLEVYRVIHQDPITVGGPANLSYILLEDGTNLLLEDGTNLLGEDYTLSTITTTPGAVTSSLLGDTVYLITKYDEEIKNGSQPVYHIWADPFVSLCKRRIVWNAADSAQASKTARGDDMMKAIMREQFGASVTDATRNISTYLTIAADAGGGVSMSKAFAHRNVFTVLQEISSAQGQAGTRCYFDITFDVVANMPTFRTYIGQRGADHSLTSGAPVIFSYQRDNLQDPALMFDFSNEINAVCAIGQGTGTERLEYDALDATRIAASPYNRREDAYDARSFSALTGLSDEANSQLWSGRPVRLISGTLLSTPDTALGLQWNLGDLVAAEFGTIQQNCMVESISISLSGGQEQATGVARSLS